MVIKPLVLGSFALLISTAKISSAQNRGIVVDEQGRPLISVAVKAWNFSGRLAVAATGADGRFVLNLDGKSPTQIIASRLGYMRGFVRYNGADSAVVIRLSLKPVDILPLTVTTARQEVQCPHAEDLKARALWQNARAHYSKATGDRGRTGEGSFAHQPKPKAELGQYDPLWLRWYWQGWNGYHLNKLFALERLAYGLRIDSSKGEDDFDNETGEWIFPKFHTAAAYHFATDRFGELHTFYILSANDDSSAVVAFCPLSNNEPEISGKLALTSHGRFDWASWTFLTPKPRDEAGGRLRFVEISDPAGGLPHLLPREGIFWRRPPGQKTFEQFVYVFDIWMVSADRCRPDMSELSPAERKRGGCSERFGD